MPTTLRKSLGLILLIFVLSTIVFSVFAINTAYAQTNEYELLAPLPGTDDKLKTSVTLSSYVSTIINLIIIIAGVSSVLMIVLGGFKYMSTDSISGKKEGMDKIKNALIGLILVLASYIILNSINPKLLDFNLNIKPAEITTRAVTPGIPMTPEQIAESNAIRASLLGNDNDGVNTYAGPCTEGQTTGCVNLNGLADTTQNGLASLNETCSCNVIITGGTESGHSSVHSTGIAVDLRLDGGLTNYIETNKIGNPQQTDLGPKYTLNIDGKNVTFLKESNHWHVVYG